MNSDIKSRLAQTSKSFMKHVLPMPLYRRVREKGLQLYYYADRVGGRIRLILAQDSKIKYRCLTKRWKGIDWHVATPLLPREMGRQNFKLVTEALSRAGIDWLYLSQDNHQAVTVAVDIANRKAVYDALVQLNEGVPLYVRGWKSKKVLPYYALTSDKSLMDDRVIAVYMPKLFDGSSLAYGAERGCQIEFWEFGQGEEGNEVIAPRENRAALRMSAADAEPVSVESDLGTMSTPTVLTRTMVDDITFPIDAVYTWVDGDDPAWLESKFRRQAQVMGREYHEEATHAARFRSRDELKYSLRSLEMFAPWFRRIFIVTAGQVPNWLDTSNQRIQVIDHRDIYPEGDYLPTFNSNSIISRLHHIPELGEHYVYINDDVFFGRDLGPDRFFTASGLAKVSPSNNRRPFGEASSSDEPHFNLTRNIRRLLEQEFGVTVSRAIKHTPHPQLKSAHFELESRFKKEYEQTWASPFRDHRDIVADQLHHYYAQIIGKAVPTRLRYHYINILDDSYLMVMQNTLRLRDRDTFCINDAPVVGAQPIEDEYVTHFLESYFPVKSSFEK